MEESVNENEPHQSFQSPPRRRRSTFFERRESLVPQNLPENTDFDLCKDSGSDDKLHQDLSSYYEKLLLEKEQWKKEVKSRRNKYHDLRQQYQMAVESSSRSTISFSTLSNEDIEFVRGKVNISKLVESQQKLQQTFKVTKALYGRVCQVEDVILDYCEERVNKITHHILEHSTVEPVD